jgi:hypothetical protein
MAPRTYRADSWIDPRVGVRASSLHGRGVFATEGIGAGEAVVIWGGTVFTEEEVRAGRVRRGSVSAIDEGLYLAGRVDDEPDVDDFTNHSCDPNVWMLDEVTLVARREIEPGEELTADYALWEAEEGWVCRWECRCGSSRCRGRVTGQDWRSRELQERYRGHFSPFIERRIDRLSDGERADDGGRGDG